MSVEIIAEMGLAHLGSLDKAKELVDIGKRAGVSIIKTQTYDPDKLVRSKDPDKKLLTELSLSRKYTIELSKYCYNSGIEFLSTPGETDSLKFLIEECGIKRIKIGSDDLTYKPLTQAAFKTGLPVILSTGMSSHEDIYDALSFDGKLPSITLMHCVSLYPTPIEKANLRRINTLRMFGHSVGYSDHTQTFVSAYMAMALGIVMIEKHFAPYKYKGPDAEVSLHPEELRLFVAGIKHNEALLGTGELFPSKEEAANIPKFRKDADGFRGRKI